MKYLIKPLKIMDFITDRSVLVYGNHFGEKIEVPVFVWLVQGNGKNILIDSGPGEGRADYQTTSGEMRNRISISQVLQLENLTPEQIDMVILTHLHWDRCGDLEKFINARIVVQADEVDYADHPLPHHYFDYDTDIVGRPPIWKNHIEKMDVIKGNKEVAPGIAVLLSKGHTPGMQAVLIENDGQKILVAGDSLPVSENWNGRGQIKHIPATIHYRLSEYYPALEGFEKLCDSLYLGNEKEPIINKYNIGS